jgi:hypothetical protein
VNIRTLTALVLSAFALSACTPGMDAMVQTVRDAMQRDSGAATVRLDPNYRYLRVTVGGRLAFLALGYVDNHPQGPIEVYYSAQREVVRLQNGRVVGVVGLSTEWRNVSMVDAPAWSTAATAQQPVQWTRVRDVMPGYRFGLRDELAVRAVGAPERAELRGIDPRSLSWFEERMQLDSRVAFAGGLFTGASAERPLPPARYAVDLRDGKESVVYGEQCITTEICFTWQRWSAEQQNKAAGSEVRGK